MQKINVGKIGIGLICLVALAAAAGCGGKNDSDAKTPQQAEEFKGHQPTPQQLQAAIAKASQHAPGPPAGAPAPKP